MANTANASRQLALGYAVESSFAEATNTYATRLLVTNIDVSGLSQPVLMRETANQTLYAGGQNHPINGPKGGSFTFTVEAYGHGADPTAALTATPLYTLLGLLMGGSEAATVGSTASSNWSTGASGAASGATIATGAMLFLGDPGDTRGGGQAALAQSYSGSTLSLRNAVLDGLDSGDDVRGALTVYPADSGTIDSTLRFWVGTANMQYWVRGCVLSGMSWAGLNSGEVPTITLTISCADWGHANETFPSTMATADKTPIYNSIGCLHFTTNSGTTTRSVDVARNITIDLSPQVVALMGPGGVGTHQNIQGWRRTGFEATLSFDSEAEAVATHTYYDWVTTSPASRTAGLAVYTCSSIHGRALAFAFPCLLPADDVPIQGEVDGLNYNTRIRLKAYSHESQSSALAKAHVLIGMG